MPTLQLALAQVNTKVGDLAGRSIVKDQTVRAGSVQWDVHERLGVLVVPLRVDRLAEALVERDALRAWSWGR